MTPRSMKPLHMLPSVAIVVALYGCQGSNSDTTATAGANSPTVENAQSTDNASAPAAMPVDPANPASPVSPVNPVNTFTLEEVPYQTEPNGVWLAGDTHVHNDHSADGSALRQGADGRGPGNVSVKDQINAAQVNGLQWVPMTDHRTYFQHYDPLWTSNSLLLIPGEEANGSPHATVLGAVESIVQNARLADLPSRNARLQQSIWDAHSQNASYGLAHPDDGDMNADGSPNDNAHVVGLDRVEAWNRGSNVEAELNFCENRWNHGYRFAVVGGSDDHFKELWAISAPGTPKTWVYSVGQTERGILTGLHRHNTYIAIGNPGPTLLLSMDKDSSGSYKSIPGDEVVIPKRPILKFKVNVSNALGMTLNVLESPGKRAKPVFSATVTSPTSQTFTIDLPWAAGKNETWFRAELRAPGQPAGLDTNAIKAMDFQKLLSDTLAQPDQLQAMTTPIFVSTGYVEPRSSDNKKLLPDPLNNDDAAIQLSKNPLRFSGFSDISHTDNGGYMVWEDHTPGGTRVIGRPLTADGQPMAATVLSGTSNFARFARVAARGNLVWVVWQDERSGQVPRRAAIYARYSKDRGQTWSPELIVRQSSTIRAEKPVVVIPKDSDLPMIAWQEINHGTVSLDASIIPPKDATGFDIVVSKAKGTLSPGMIKFTDLTNVSVAGKTYTAPNPLDTRSAKYFASIWPSLAVNEETGEILLAYQDNRNDPDPLWTGATLTGDSHDNDLFQVRIHSYVNSVWGSGKTLGATTQESRHPSIGFSKQGAVVTWVGRSIDSPAGVNLAVFSSLRQCKNGASVIDWCTPTVLGNTGQSASGQYPRVGTNSRGQAVASWYDSRSADWRFKVAYAVLGDDNSWSSANLILAQGNNTWPALSKGWVSFTSSRNARRLQRDKTHEIFLIKLP